MNTHAELADYMLLQLDGLDGVGPTMLADVTLVNAVAAVHRFDTGDSILSATLIAQSLPPMVDRSADYPGPQTPHYNELHPKAQELFRKADKAYYEATSGRHLTIESGIRTVYRQAELYICWRLGEAGCNPANIPGASIHNYGLAIDIQRSGEAQVVTALDNNGWDRTVMPREPWHWECVGTAEHTAALAKQREMKAAGSIARRWQRQWETARTKNDNRNRMIDDFNQRVTVWQPQWDQLGRDIEAYNTTVERHQQRVEQWNRDRATFNARVDRYNQEVAHLRELRARIEAMEPSPERDRLIAEYNRRAAAAQQEAAAIERERADLNQRAEQLNREAEELRLRKAELESRHATLEAEGNALLALRDEIERLRAEIEEHMAESRRLLEEIARQVHP